MVLPVEGTSWSASRLQKHLTNRLHCTCKVDNGVNSSCGTFRGASVVYGSTRIGESMADECISTGPLLKRLMGKTERRLAKRAADTPTAHQKRGVSNPQDEKYCFGKAFLELHSILYPSHHRNDTMSTVADDLRAFAFRQTHNGLPTSLWALPGASRSRSFSL